jgi:hypothetical protein
MPKEYFERLYEEDADPWGFATSWYEARKYALTIAALPKATYRSAFEPGCSIGVLTEQLATRCGQVLAGDEIPSVDEQARARTASLANVEVCHLTIPDDWPDTRFDLVVLSEIGYYFDQPELEALLRLSHESLEPGGNLVAVHWRGATNYPLTGDRTHEVIDGSPGLSSRVHHLEKEFILDVWERTGS